jgi:hypothetical protein
MPIQPSAPGALPLPRSHLKRVYSITRDLHLYIGLFLCPFILVFAVSTFLLNHPTSAAPGSPVAVQTSQSIRTDASLEPGSLPQALDFLHQLHVTGEIDYVRHNAKTGRLFIPVTKPGETIKVEVDLRAQTATVERQDVGLGAAMIYLHKMPGPHNARFRGNWVYMAWWKIAADVTVYGTLFLTLSGLYLWWILKAERTIGWILIGAGAVSVALLVTGLLA